MWSVGGWLAVLVRHLDHLCVMNLNKPVRDHVVKSRQNLVHLLRCFNKFDANRQVLRQDLDFRGVHLTMGAESGHCPRGRRAGYTFVEQEGEDRIAEGVQMMLRILVDVYRNFLGGSSLEHTRSSDFPNPARLWRRAKPRGNPV
jgi:hypothetical protein